MKRERIQLAKNALLEAIDLQNTIHTAHELEQAAKFVRLSDLVVFQFKSKNQVQYLWHKDNRLATYDFSFMMDNGLGILNEGEEGGPQQVGPTLPDPMETWRKKLATPLSSSLLSHILRKSDDKGV